MKQILTASFLLISSLGITQQFIDRDQAIQLAIDYGIAEPLDSLTATLVNDTIWEVESFLCEDYNHTQTEIYRIDAITGEKYEENYGRFTASVSSSPFPKTKLNYNGIIDSVLLLNSSAPLEVLPDLTVDLSQPNISPDNKWIAFRIGYTSLGITSLEGESYRVICDKCGFPYWTEKENMLLYVKNKEIIEHNVQTDEITSIQNCNDRIHSYSYCPTGNWFASIKSFPRTSDNPNEIIVSMNGADYDLFIFSLETDKEIRITHSGNISNPVWNYSGDTLFFNDKDVPYSATEFDLSEPQVGVANHLKNITVWDYTKSVDGVFPYIRNCQIYLVSTTTLKPLNYIVKDRGRYSDVTMSKDGNYITYTMKKNGVKRIYLIKNE